MYGFLCKILEIRELQKHTAQYGTILYFPPEKQRISQPTFAKTFIKICEKILKNHTFERKIFKNNSRGFELNTLKMTILEP